MRHIDLFSGIGGFALAVDTVWPNSEHIFCDNDSFCQSVLRKHWPNSYIFGDIDAFHISDINAIMEAWKEEKTEIALNVELNLKRKGVLIASPAMQLGLLNGDKITMPTTEQRKLLGLGKQKRKSSYTTEEDAFVAENQTEHSLPLTTNMGEEIWRDEHTTPRHGNLLFGINTPTTTKSSVITATTPNIITKYAHTKIDILTGGFPCQPFSQAGRRRGTQDNRFKWPEMFRVIREFKPTWVIAENVRGLVTWNEGMVLEQVCADLESEGYEVQPIIIPAVAVNAPHRRDRIWFIANRNGERGGTQRHGYNQDGQESYEGRQEQPQYRSNGQSGNATYTESWRRRSQGGEMDSQGQSARNSGWDRPWIEVAAELCIVDDGLPNGLVRPRGWRNAALKAAGNAIVPQVAIQIMQAIKLTQ